MTTECEGKASWPELLGVYGETAAATIKRENPYVDRAVLVPEGSAVTADWRCNRVFIWINKAGYVYEIPTIG
ncbi:hypothetical protein MKX03_019145 [Papaver bracteatum]|nr:hypothetical protein MKX03_019145 [Papaver bracteatum]